MATKILRPTRSELLYANYGGAAGPAGAPVPIPSRLTGLRFDAVMLTPIALKSGPASDNGGIGFAGDCQVDFLAWVLQESEQAPAQVAEFQPQRVGQPHALFRGLNCDAFNFTDLGNGSSALSAATGPCVLLRRAGSVVVVAPRLASAGAGNFQVGEILLLVTLYDEVEDEGQALGGSGTGAGIAGGADAFSGADGLGGIAGGLAPRGRNN